MFSFDESSLQAAIEQFDKRVKQKIDSIGYRRDLFCYLLVEELLLLLDVPAVYVRVFDVSRSPSGAPLVVGADTNVSDTDLAILVGSTEGHPVALAAGVTKRPIGNKPKLGQLMNGSLRTLDWQAELQVQVELPVGNVEVYRSLVVAFWGTNPQEDDGRGHIVQGLMKGKASCDSFLGKLEAILGTVPLPSYASTEASESEQDSFDLDVTFDKSSQNVGFVEQKQAFFQESKRLDAEGLRQAYRQRFLPLITVVDRVHRWLVDSHERFPGHTSEYIFSYRTSRERGISFLLTTNQVARLLQDSREDLEDLLTAHFVRSSYDKEPGYVGLNGYVLESGHSMFSPDPRKEPLWSSRSSPSDAVHPRSSDRHDRIHFLIGKLQQLSAPVDQSRLSTDVVQKNTFIVPLYVCRSRHGQRTLQKGKVEVPATEVMILVECRLPDKYEDQLAVRRNLFDLAWDFMPAIDASIAAQRATEHFLRTEELRRFDLGRWAALIHDLPKQVVQPTETAVKNAKQQFGSLCTEVKGLLPIVRVDQINREHELAIMMIRHASTLLRFAAPKSHFSDNKLEKRTIKLSDFQEEFPHALKTFVEARVEARFGADTSRVARPEWRVVNIAEHIKASQTYLKY